MAVVAPAPGAAVPDKKEKTSAAPKAAKAAKEPKDPNAPKAPRKPREDYGYLPGAKITLVDQVGEKYKGKRKTYYDILKANDGKTVEDFAKACPEGDGPRGWMRFLVQNGAATLSGGSKPEPKVKAEPKKEEAAA